MAPAERPPGRGNSPSLVQGPSAARPLQAKTNRRPAGYEQSFLANSLMRAKETRCPNARGFYAVSASTGAALAIPCKAWGCPHCVRVRRATVAYMIEAGVCRAQARGEKVRFLTVTSPGGYALSTRELYESFNRLRTTLRKSGELKEYLAVVELQERDGGAPHLHIIATGEFIPQRRLSKLASGAGFGPIADIRAVRGTGPRSAGMYLVKSLAQYATKANAGALAERVKSEGSDTKARRVRPVRCSQGWYPGGMKDAQKHMLQLIGAAQGEQDPGPWFMVSRSPDGNIHTISRPKPVEEADQPMAEERPQGPATMPEGREAVTTARAA